jgi:hypothetical protein
MRKEKNLIFVDTEKGSYIYDINSGVCYGLRGKAIKRIPSKALQAEKPTTQFLKAFKRLYDSSLRIKRDVIIIQQLDSLSQIVPEYHQAAFIRRFLDLTDCEREKILKNAKLLKVFNYCINDVLDYLDFKTVSQLFKNEVDLIVHRYGEKKAIKLVSRVLIYARGIENKSEIEFILYYLGLGYQMFFEDTFYRDSTGYFGCCDVVAELAKKVKNYLYLCRAMDKKPQRTRNFIQEYVNTVMEYKVNQIEFDKRLLYKWQNSINLVFENELFTVVVPTKEEQFKKEAESQNNCVYRIYYSLVMQEKTHIVFIRSKTDVNDSLVTCEISNDGRIIQYLTKYNRNVKNGSNLHQFKIEYQNYLNSVFQKSSL